MRKNITKRERKFKEICRAVLFVILVLSIFLGWAMVAGAETSLYMDVVVTSVEGTKVTFMNADGNTFEFKGVTYPFKVGDESALEVVAVYDRKIEGFRIITIYHMIPEKEQESVQIYNKKTFCAL
jgi:hypothetical protein